MLVSSLTTAYVALGVEAGVYRPAAQIAPNLLFVSLQSAWLWSVHVVAVEARVHTTAGVQHHWLFLAAPAAFLLRGILLGWTSLSWASEIITYLALLSYLAALWYTADALDLPTQVSAPPT